MAVALDTESVGMRDGKSSLARVAIVDSSGRVLLDRYCKPEGDVKDYRTSVSGVSRGDLNGAPSIANVRREVQGIIQGKTLVGHDLDKDLHALGISHYNKRDTSTNSDLRNQVKRKGDGGNSLANMSQKVLGRNIQAGPHSPVEDARATMDLHNTARW